MAVALLQTLPSLSCKRSLSANRVAAPKLKVTCIRCCKSENSDGCFRRDVLKSVGAAMGMELLSSSGNFTHTGNAADLIQRKQRAEFQSSLRETLSVALTKNPDLIPSILTLALNDAITYDKATKSGGANGSIRFSSEIDRPENKGLSGALSLLDDAKKEIDSNSKGGPISYADLIQFGAQSALKLTFLEAAIQKAGGKRDKGAQLYAAYGSNGQWNLFDKQFGRTDAESPDPEGRVPQWSNASVKEMLDKFIAVGLGPRQLAVMSAFLGPDLSATEEFLAKDPEVAKWIDSYQRSRATVSRTNYEVDLITTLTKLSSFGQVINYEAYTYAPPRIDLTKLKL